VDHYFEDFLATVARGRGLSVDAVRQVADGRMLTADDALALGLADRVATYGDTLRAMLSAGTESRRKRLAI